MCSWFQCQQLILYMIIQIGFIFEFLWLAYSNKTKVSHESNDYLQYKVEINEIRNIFKKGLKDSFDTNLTLIKSDIPLEDICRPIQKHVMFHPMHNYTYVEKQQFNPSKPFQLNTLMSIEHIKDGVMTLTSDSYLRLSKLKYKDDNLTLDTFWSASISKFISPESQPPQLLYEQDLNEVLLLLDDDGYYLSVSNMEKDSKQTELYALVDWQSAELREYTIYHSGYIYSAVGVQGLQVYQVRETLSNIKFTKLITVDSLNLTDIKDLCSVNGTNLLYILDHSKGIFLFQIMEDGNLQLVIAQIGARWGAIAVENSNEGSSLVAIYEEYGHYFAVEYQVDIKGKQWVQVRQQDSYTKLRDIKINSQFAILMGLEYSQLFFLGINQEFTSNQKEIVMHTRGLRGLVFYEGEKQKGKNKTVEIEDYTYYADDILIGITSSDVVLSRYRVQTSCIQCYPEEENTVDVNFEYELVYNTTCKGEDAVREVCQHRRHFQVKVVDVVVRDVDPTVLVVAIVGSIAFVVFLVLCLCCSYRHYKRQEEYEQKRLQDLSVKYQAVSQSQIIVVQ